jgi:WD40 repeat protein/class 3 adenylate cyclase
VTVGFTPQKPREGAAVLTFLIADIRGYTSFTQNQGDEASARLAKRFAEVAEECVEALGGSLIELRGDEALAVFASARGAIRAAAELQDAFKDETASDPQLPLPVGIGLDAGEAVPVAGGYRGGAVNLAARLCAQAGAGEILASPEVVHLARKVEGVRYERQAALELKGLEEPVGVFAVVTDGRERADPIAPAVHRAEALPDLPAVLDLASALVGREHELRWLRWSWRRARHGHGRAAFVTGPKGIGKTRITAELAHIAWADGSIVLCASAANPNDAARVFADAEAPHVPLLLIVDDLERASGPTLDTVVTLSRSLEGRASMLLGVFGDEGRSTSLATFLRRADPTGNAQLSLGPLDATGVREVAELYVGAAAGELPTAAMLEQTEGVPLRVHEAVSQWVTARATTMLRDSVDRAAKGKSDIRVVESELVTNVVDLQVARERSKQFGPEAVAEASAPEPEAPVICPFKGLATFDASDADFFYGRERLVAELVARLVGTSFLGVVGPSGSGKSSAVRAGLIPAIATGVLPGSDGWTRVLLRPGEKPNRELARVLDRAGRTLDDGARLILLVDQFEEVFTACADEGERIAFIDALTSAGTSSDRTVTVIVAIRADYYGRCAAYPDLAELLGANQVLVGPMQPDEIRRAIELPARRAGLRVQPDLVDTLVGEVVDEPGALPLLSTALLELWQGRSGRTISMETYRKTGGVRGAVGRLAEGAFHRLDPDQRSMARAILLRLAGQGEGDAVVRRRVPLSEFDVERNEDAARVLAVLTDARLLTASEGSVEVAHEALLREWPRLRAWLEEDVQGRQLHLHLIQAAKEWQDGGEDPADLYRGARLASAMDWTGEHSVALNELERGFLDESTAVSNLEADRALRTNRRLRGLLAGVAVFLAVALVAGSLAVVQRRHAQQEATLADARWLATQALADDHVDQALLLALAAVRLDDSVETRGALLTSLFKSPEAIGVMNIPQSPVNISLSPVSISLSADGRTLAVGGAGYIDLFDTRTRQAIGEPVRVAATGFTGVGREVAYSPTAPSIAMVGQTDRGRGSLDLIDASSRHVVIHEVFAERTSADSVAYSPDGSTVAVAVNINDIDANRVGKMIVLFNARTGARLGRLVLKPKDVSGGYTTVAFLTGGELVGSTEEGTTVLWNQRSAGASRTFPVGGDLALSPDGRMAALGQQDGSVILLDLRNNGRRTMSAQRPGGFEDLSFTPDSRTLLSANGSENRDVDVWDVASAEHIGTWSGPTGVVQSVAVSRNGRSAYTAGSDGTVFIWDVGGDDRLGRPLALRPAPPLSPTFDLGGTLVAASHPGAGIDIWDLRTRSRVSTLPDTHFVPGVSNRPGGDTWGVAFNPDGRLLLTTGTDGTAHLWDVRRRSMIGSAIPGTNGIGWVAAFSSDGRMFATAGDNCLWSGVGNACTSKDNTHGKTRALTGSFIVWDARTRNRLHTFTLGGSPFSPSGLAFSPDGRYLAGIARPYGFPAGQAAVWDISSHRRVVFVKHSTATVVAFAPDGRTVAMGNDDGTVTFWDIETGKPAAPPLQALDEGFMNVDYSPDGNTLVAAGQSRAVTLWDLATRKQIGADFPGPPNEERPVARFTPDGSHLLVAYGHGGATLWDLDPAAWEAQACTVAGRNLTRDEWRQFLPDRPYETLCP